MPSKGQSVFTDETREAILTELRKGRALVRICRDEGMPDREMVRQWANADPEFASAIYHAREIGYEEQAEQLLENANKAKDAALGTLAWRAGTWHLGRLSQVFRDKTVHSNDPDSPMPAPAVTVYQLPDNGRDG